MYYIYKLVFKGEDRFYIGQTKDLDKRYESHWSGLTNNKHHNVYLQNWFNKNKPSFMGMVVLDSFEDKELCDQEEVRLINETYESNFNISRNSGGGDLTSYHPLNKEIRDKMSKASKLVWQNPEYKEKMRSILKGEGNPNYKDGRTLIERKCYDCSAEIKSYFSIDKPVEDILCTSCRSKKRIGELNSFYGKTHSEETRKHLSKVSKERFLEGKTLGCLRKLVANGKLFQSCSDCASHYGINRSVITYRVNSDKWDYDYPEDGEDTSNYEIMPRVLEKSEKTTDARTLNTRPVIADGVYYKSLSECAKALGLKTNT